MPIHPPRCPTSPYWFCRVHLSALCISREARLTFPGTSAALYLPLERYEAPSISLPLFCVPMSLIRTESIHQSMGAGLLSRALRAVVLLWWTGPRFTQAFRPLARLVLTSFSHNSILFAPLQIELFALPLTTSFFLRSLSLCFGNGCGCSNGRRSIDLPR